MARNNIDKILSRASEDPKVARLMEIGVTVTNLEKEKIRLKANKEKLDKKDRNEKLAVVNAKLSELKKEKDSIKNGGKTPTATPGKVKEPEPVVPVSTPETPTDTQPAQVEVTPATPAPVVEAEPKKVTEPELLPKKNNLDAERLEEINKLKEEKKQNQIEAIKFGKQMGQSKEALAKLGIDKNLIDEIYGDKVEQAKPSVDKGKLDALMQQIMLYMENEAREREEYEQERQQDLDKIAKNEAKLAELMELREKLAEEGDQDKEPAKSEEELEEERRNAKEERFKIDETASENIQKMQKMILEYHENKKIINEKREELDVELSKKKGLKIWKYILPNIKVKKLKKEIKKLESSQEELEEVFEIQERKEFPEAYYAVEKIKNPMIKSLFLAKGKKGQYISMKKINRLDKDFMYDNSIYNPIHQSISTNTDICRVGPSGFVIKIVNREEIADENGYYSIDNPLGRYNVIDPDNKIILENANFDDAWEKELAEKYKYNKQVEEEWNNLNKK